MKGNKRGLFKYIYSNSKDRENVGLLLNSAGVLLAKDTEESSPWSLLVRSFLRNLRPLRPEGKSGVRKT